MVEFAELFSNLMVFAFGAVLAWTLGLARMLLPHRQQITDRVKSCLDQIRVAATTACNDRETFEALLNKYAKVKELETFVANVYSPRFRRGLTWLALFALLGAAVSLVSAQAIRIWGSTILSIPSILLFVWLVFLASGFSYLVLDAMWTSKTLPMLERPSND